MSLFGIPENGMTREDVGRALDEVMKEDTRWEEGRIFGLIYHADPAVVEVATMAATRALMHNGLSPMAFPSLLRMEKELLGAVGSLLHGEAGRVAGSLTSGGSESILLAMKAARDWARETRPGVAAPEVILPVSAHPAWNKAAHFLGLEVVTVPVDAGFTADMDAVLDAMTDETIMLAASATSYPQGVIDPIEAMGALALERDLWLHVDACLGGLMLPWLERLGHDIPRFDFRVPGVSSISADLHKYGYAPKGVSTVLYRTHELRLHQFFAHTGWPGGIMVTPGVAGARPGGAIAAAWAVMKYLGENGFMEMMGRAKEATDRLIAGIRGMPGFSVLGDPKGTVFAFASDRHDSGALSGALKERGWHVEVQQLPPCLHMTVMPAQLEVADRFLADLEGAARAVAEGDDDQYTGAAVMYGMLAAMADRDEADRFVVQAMSDLYSIDPGAGE